MRIFLKRRLSISYRKKKYFILFSFVIIFLDFFRSFFWYLFCGNDKTSFRYHLIDIFFVLVLLVYGKVVCGLSQKHLYGFHLKPPTPKCIFDKRPKQFLVTIRTTSRKTTIQQIKSNVIIKRKKCAIFETQTNVEWKR